MPGDKCGMSRDEVRFVVARTCAVLIKGSGSGPHIRARVGNAEACGRLEFVFPSLKWIHDDEKGRYGNGLLIGIYEAYDEEEYIATQKTRQWPFLRHSQLST